MPPRGAGESGGLSARARELLSRLESRGPRPRAAAEELDRLQAAVERAGRLEQLRAAVRSLCGRMAARGLPGEEAAAWLILVGGFGLAEAAERAAEMAGDPVRPAGVRVLACRALPGLDREAALLALPALLFSGGDPLVRQAAAEAIGELREPALRPELEALLEEELPRALWSAVSAALERLG